MTKTDQTKKDILFLIAWVPYLTVAFLRFTVLSRFLPENSIDAVLWFCFVCLVLKECISERRPWTFLWVSWIIVNYVLFAFSWFLGGLAIERLIAFMFAFIYSAADVDVKKLLRVSFVVVSFWFCVTLGLCALGRIPNYLIGEGTERVRMCLGFTYALYPSTMLANLLTMAFLLVAELCKIQTKQQIVMRIRWFCGIVAVLGAIGNFVLYRLSDARMNFVYCWILILLLLVKSVFPKGKLRNRVLRIVVFPCMLVYPLCAAGSLYIAKAFTWEIPWMNRLNQILGRRLELAHNSLNNHGYHLGVRMIGWSGHGLNAEGLDSGLALDYVDNLYVQVFQRYGIMVSALLLVVLTVVMIRCYQNRNYSLMIVLVLIALHIMIDDLFFYLEFQMVWLLCGSVVLNRADLKAQEAQQ